MTFGGIPFGRIAATLLMFHLTCIGWLFFRAESLEQMAGMTGTLLTDLTFTARAATDVLDVAFFLTPLLVMQTFQYFTGDLSCFFQWKPQQRLSFMLTCGFLALYVVLLGSDARLGGGNEFIYFQF